MSPWSPSREHMSPLVVPAVVRRSSGLRAVATGGSVILRVFSPPLPADPCRQATGSEPAEPRSSIGPAAPARGPATPRGRRSSVRRRLLPAEEEQKRREEVGRRRHEEPRKPSWSDEGRECERKETEGIEDLGLTYIIGVFIGPIWVS